jgi:hypothetical protein
LVALEAVTLSVCDAGAVPFTAPLKDRLEFPKVSAPPETVLFATFTTTGTVNVVLAAPVDIVKFATLIPLGSAAPFMVRTKPAVVVAFCCCTVSQLCDDEGFWSAMAEPSLDNTWTTVVKLAVPPEYDAFTTAGLAKTTGLVLGVTNSDTLTV